MRMNINEDLIFTSFILRNNQSTVVEYDSKNWNLYRVSGNDRYTETLTPTFEDKIVHVPGQKGSYYFGTKYKDKPLSINVAFDNLTIAKFNQMISVFKNLVMQDEPAPLQLIFDDTPYKMNLVYLQNPPTFSYVPFDEDGETVLKGEGTISFICFEPFARSTEYRVLAGVSHLSDFRDVNKKISCNLTHKVNWWSDNLNNNELVNVGDFDLSPIIKINSKAIPRNYNKEISIKNKLITITCAAGTKIKYYFKIFFPSDAQYIIIDCANSQAYDDSFNNLEIQYDYINYQEEANCNIILPSAYQDIVRDYPQGEQTIYQYHNSRSMVDSRVTPRQPRRNYVYTFNIYPENMTYDFSNFIELIYDYLYM